MTSDPLVRSASDRKMAGVCGGLARWLDWDPTALRIVWMLVSLFTGFFPGLLVYIVLAVIMPAEGSA
jgi:phage shock protein C